VTTAERSLVSLVTPRVARYVESCRVADGGYFFARVAPAAAQDTHFALASLRLLGRQPEDREGVRRWLKKWCHTPSNVSGIHGAYLVCRLLDELGEDPSAVRSYAREVAKAENDLGGYGACENLYVECRSELQATYEAVWVLTRLGYTVNDNRVARFLSLFHQAGGGFGVGRSSLPSTYYACATVRLLEASEPRLDGARLFLRRRADRWDVYFLDDVFWLVEGLALTGGAQRFAAQATTHVLACQRAQGGFARVPIIGIQTLEHTYYAMQILHSLGLLRGGGPTARG
jgi:hypothetical protein